MFKKDIQMLLTAYIKLSMQKLTDLKIFIPTNEQTLTAGKDN